MKRTWLGIIILALTASCTVSHPQSAVNAPTTRLTPDDQPVAPGKFIPTFDINYGRLRSSSLQQTARFDLIDAEPNSVSNDSTWLKLKQLNPHLKIFIYELGPSECGASTRPSSDHKWEWITANHGKGSADRWTAIGAKYGDYLQGKEYDGERLMIVGNPAWQQYWLDQLYSKVWALTSPNRDADGVFADNTTYRLPSEHGWDRENHAGQTDVPADYYHNGAFQGELWKSQVRKFFARAVPWLADRQCEIMPNFGYMARYPQNWPNLDSLPHPVFAAMEEGAFATPWGGKGLYTFYKEQEWLNQVNTLRHLKHVRALMLVHGLPAPTKRPSLKLMDLADKNGNRGWDVLWFGLASFLQGYDDVRQNAYFGFTVWGYERGIWMDEFDPAHLNLGRAIDESHRVDGAVGYCYLREFENGWAVVNPTVVGAKGVPVPSGQACVLDHYTFEHSEAQPLVALFDLPSHRGVVLLKPGRPVGSAGHVAQVSTN